METGSPKLPKTLAEKSPRTESPGRDTVKISTIIKMGF